MSWRMPALEKGTILISNDLPVTYYSDNSLTGPLNWIYSPPGEMNVILYFASVRVGKTLPKCGARPAASVVLHWPNVLWEHIQYSCI